MQRLLSVPCWSVGRSLAGKCKRAAGEVSGRIAEACYTGAGLTDFAPHGEVGVGVSRMQRVLCSVSGDSQNRLLAAWCRLMQGSARI